MTVADVVTLSLEGRSALGRKNRALRRAGKTPVHIYGRGQDSVAAQADAHQLALTLIKVGHTTPLTLTNGGHEDFVMVREIQKHPVSGRVLHVDFLRISRTEKVTVTVPLHLHGEAPAARLPGMAVLQDLHEIEVSALPTDLPHEIVVEIRGLTEAGATIHAGDLALPTGVTLVTEAGHPVVRIVQQRAQEAAPKPAEGEETAAAAETKGEEESEK